jgi:hypothetical protein
MFIFKKIYLELRVLTKEKLAVFIRAKLSPVTSSRLSENHKMAVTSTIQFSNLLQSDFIGTGKDLPTLRRRLLLPGSGSKQSTFLALLNF